MGRRAGGRGRSDGASVVRGLSFGFLASWRFGVRSEASRSFFGVVTPLVRLGEAASPYHLESGTELGILVSFVSFCGIGIKDGVESVPTTDLPLI